MFSHPAILASKTPNLSRFMRRLAFLFTTALTAIAQAADSTILYNRDIRPVLAHACFKCHGPDSASRQADLRLDQRDAAVEAGAFEPGEPDESEAIRRIFSDDADKVMPPPDQPNQLTAAQKDPWDDSGAERESRTV